MIPLPPLDGSKIIVAFLPYGAQQKYRELTMLVERYGIFATFAFIFIFINIMWKPFSELVSVIFKFITGMQGF